MTRREFLHRTTTGAAAVGIAGCAHAFSPNRQVTNAIVIISDTMRRDALGCYGTRWIETPYLDRFAAKSLIFDNAFIESFPTVPNRHDILTAQHTFTFKAWSPLDNETVTIQDVLNRAGIITALVVDTPHPFAPGYNYQRNFRSWELIRGQEHDAWRSAPKHVTLPCAPNKLRNADATVVQYLRNVAERTREEDYFVAQTMRTASRWLEKNLENQPFFLYVDTFDPHEPWDPPREYVDRYDKGYRGEEVIYPRYDAWRDFLSEDELKHCRALYAGEATLVDRWTGHLLDTVESLGQMENTIIFYTSDHGFYLGDHGFIGKSLIRGGRGQSLPLYTEVCRIPFIVHVPGCDGGKKIQSLVQPVDIAPTIFDYLGVEIPGSFKGCSLRRTIEGGDISLRPVAISSPTISHPQMKRPHPSVRSSITDAEWLLVYGAQTEPAETRETTRDVDSQERVVTDLLGKPITPELYHLTDDPNCNTNVLEQHADIARKLHESYFKFLEQAGVRPDHLALFKTPPA